MDRLSKAHAKLRHETQQWGTSTGTGQAGQAMGWAAVQAEGQDSSIAPSTNASFPLLSSIMDPMLSLERTAQAAKVYPFFRILQYDAVPPSLQSAGLMCSQQGIPRAMPFIRQQHQTTSCRVHARPLIWQQYAAISCEGLTDATVCCTILNTGVNEDSCVLQARAQAAKHSLGKGVKRTPNTPKAPRKRKLRNQPSHVRFEDGWSDTESSCTKQQEAEKAGDAPLSSSPRPMQPDQWLL